MHDHRSWKPGSARLRLPVAKKPVYVKIGPGISLGYRRNQSAGTWVARVADGKGGNWTKRVGVADDFDDSDENTIFDYWQAQRRVHALARAGNEEAGDSSKPIIVAQALADYERDLSARGGDLASQRSQSSPARSSWRSQARQLAC